MLNETEILFNNISNFRQLLTEDAADNRIVDAINNYKYLYIYYAGDNTIETGWRTIRPFRLGLLKSNTTGKNGKPIENNNGQLVLRAWQDYGAGGAGSDAYYNPRPGKERAHDIQTDTDGREKPGWRLFLVHNITQVLPTGKRFVDANGKVMIPPKYKETDKFIPSAVAKISISQPKMVQTKGMDSLNKPDVVAHKVDKSVFEPQAAKFKDFYNVTKKNKNITKDNVRGLYDMIRIQKKKSPNNYLVAIDKNGDFQAIPVSQKDKIPQDVIVGNLMTLYDSMVRPPVAQDAEMKKFVEKTKSALAKNATVKENIEKIPIERKTFFK
jgi:hypothetical protein